MATAVVASGDTAGGGGEKATRLPRWTRREILVLIQAKWAADERGWSRGRAAALASSSPSPPTPLLGPSPGPKWAAVASFCRRKGVHRGPLQCRKRWGNLAGDFRKIKQWESRKGANADSEHVSFWDMRSDMRREKKLPGFFDKEVFDVLDGKVDAKVAVAGVVGGGPDDDMEEEEDVVLFDSGRAVGDNGLFSDCDDEHEEDAGEDGEEDRLVDTPVATVTVAALPISEKRVEQFDMNCSAPGSDYEKPKEDNPETHTAAHEGNKRQRMSSEDLNEDGIQSQLIESLERSSRLLAAQLEAQNVNWQLDREQRREQTNGLLEVFNKLADALGRIADKL